MESRQAVEAERKGFESQEDGQQLRGPQHEQQTHGAPEEQGLVLAAENPLPPQVALGGQQTDQSLQQHDHGEGEGERAGFDQSVESAVPAGDDVVQRRDVISGVAGSQGRQHRESRERPPQRRRERLEEQDQDAARGEHELREQQHPVEVMAHRPASVATAGAILAATVTPGGIAGRRDASWTSGSSIRSVYWPSTSSSACRLGCRKALGATPIHNINTQRGTSAATSRKERSESSLFSSLVIGPQIVSWIILSR